MYSYNYIRGFLFDIFLNEKYTSLPFLKIGKACYFSIHVYNSKIPVENKIWTRMIWFVFNVRI